MGHHFESRVAEMVSVLNGVSDRDIFTATRLLQKRGMIPRVAGCFDAMNERGIVNDGGFPVYRASAILALEQVSNERLGVVEGNDTEPDDEQGEHFGLECTCHPSCPSVCKGGCGCHACSSNYGDHISERGCDPSEWGSVGITDAEVAFQLEAIGIRPDHRSFKLIWEAGMSYAYALSSGQLPVDDLRATDFFYAEPPPIPAHKIDCMCIRCLG